MRTRLPSFPSSPNLFLFPALLLFLLAGARATAQVPTQTLRGTVTDAESHAPLGGVNVVILDLDPPKGAITDERGEFKITEVPVGRHNLRLRLSGYEDRLIPEVLVSSGKEVVLAVPLTESINEAAVETVEIKGNESGSAPVNDMASVSARSFSLDETKRYAASVNDPARMASAFAGVVSNNDQSNEIVIRGNSPRGLLWRIEGIEIPNPNHFSEEGASGGGVSMLSASMMDQSDFYTGAFPAEYGNALSGVFDIQLRKGNDQQREYALQLGTLGADFAFEGPFSKKSRASYLVNYRYSTLAVLKLWGLKVAGNAVPDYQDLSWRLYFPTRKAGVFSCFALGGLSQIFDEAKRDSTEWTTERSRHDESFRSDMGVAGLSHLMPFGEKTYLKSVVAISGSRVRFTDSRVQDDYSTQDQYREQYLSTAVRASFLLNRKLSARHTVRAGLIFGQLNYDFSVESRATDSSEMATVMDRNGGSQQWQTYIQWKWRLSERLQLNAGMHYLFFSMNADHSVEPRAGLRWDLDSKTTLSLGGGLHSRLEPMTTYLGEQVLPDSSVIQPNRNIRFTRAAHAVLGLDKVLLKDLHTRVEIYYQYLFRVPVADDSNSSFSTLNYEGGLIDYPLVNTGTGRNFGVDITLQKYLTHNWYFLGTGSVFTSRYTAPDGVERSTRFNGGHALNLLAGREFRVGKKNDKSNLLFADLRFVWTGGQRYTPLDLAASQAAGSGIFLYDQRYSLQNPDFLRLDLRFGYRKNRPKSCHILSVDVRNATNRQNVFRQFYNAETQQIETTYQLGIIPVLNYRVEF